MEASLAKLWRPLGAILIEWQLISEEQLAVALAEQERTGRRLGEVLVDLELVPRDVLVSVLLEQCGLENETQSGFGSGLLTELRKRGSVHRTAPLQVVVEQTSLPVAEAPIEPEKAPESQPEPVREAEPVVAAPERRNGGERRLPWGRRKAERNGHERADRLAAAFATLETWAAELQREVVEMRRVISEAAR